MILSLNIIYFHHQNYSYHLKAFCVDKVILIKIPNAMQLFDFKLYMNNHYPHHNLNNFTCVCVYVWVWLDDVLI